MGLYPVFINSSANGLQLSRLDIIVTCGSVDKNTYLWPGFKKYPAPYDMFLFKRESDIKEYLAFQRACGNTIGFAPTMGALHQGHLSLIQRSKSENDCTVCSIFVNPTQFNKADDLKLYPRTTAKDIELLLKVGCQLLFFPSTEEIYPQNGKKPTKMDFGALTTVMEGKFRPGHFEGVVQVVERLLNIVEPDHLYLGEKDFQQFTIIKAMVEKLQLKTKVIGVPIVREPDGLAMSSRNVRLSAEQRKIAPEIYQTLQEVGAMINRNSPEEIRHYALKKLSRPGFQPEYFEIVDRYSLQPVNSFEDTDDLIVCTAVWLGEIRLIDNLIVG